MYSLRPVWHLRSILAQPHALYPLALSSIPSLQMILPRFLTPLHLSFLAGDWFPFRFQKSCSLARWLFLAPPKKKIFLFFPFTPHHHNSLFYLPYCLPVTVVMITPTGERKSQQVGLQTLTTTPVFKNLFYVLDFKNNSFYKVFNA